MKLKYASKKRTVTIFIAHRMLIISETDLNTKITQSVASFSILSVWDMLINYFITSDIYPKDDITGFRRRQEEAFHARGSTFEIGGRK